MVAGIWSGGLIDLRNIFGVIGKKLENFQK
jgi:hypothetical protein